MTNDSNVNIQVDYKKILLIAIITLVILLSIGYLFYINLSKDKTETIEVTVKYVSDNYIIATTSDTKDYKFNVDEEFDVGDRLSLKIDNINNKVDPIEADIKDIKVVSRSVELTIHDDGNTNNKNSNSTTNNEQSNNSNSSFNKTTSEGGNANDINGSVGTEKDVINYFKSLDSSLDKSKNSSSITSSIKDGFVTVVDFLFYGKTIKGKTFNELSTSAKLNILKIALSIDQKIDSYFPGYKATLSDKYNNVKSKVISMYLDITTDVCSKNESTCNAAKDGLSDLKKNFSVTWSFIKDISGVGISKLKNWYEVWKDA